MNHDWPLSYRWAQANGIKKMVPWHFYANNEGFRIDAVFVTECVEAVEVRTFAFRQDCDDFAAFVVIDGCITGEVIYFHPSFEGSKNPYLVNSRFSDLYSFLSEVVFEDTKDWMLKTISRTSAPLRRVDAPS